MTYKPTLCLDFDGVLHSYKGWCEDFASDPPVEGAVRFCKKMQEHFTLVVYTTRARDSEGAEKVTQWLSANHFPEMPVTAVKPICFLTLDDRAMLFTGVFPSLRELKHFEPWWKWRNTNGDAPAVSEGSEEEDEEEALSGGVES